MRLRVVLVAGIATLAAASPARAATFTVTGTDDAAGSCTGTVCTTLRAALTEADRLSGADAIKLGAATYNVTSGELAVHSDVTIAGPNASTAGVRGGGKTRVFEVAGDGKLTAQHLTISNGFAESAGDTGGNVLVDAAGQLVLDHVRVTGGTSFRGGGIAIAGGGTAQISHSLIDNNQAVFVIGATSGDGGGVLALGNKGAAAGIALSITDSTITANTASSSAGIVARDDTRNVTTLTRSTVSGNLGGSNSEGAGIYVPDAESFTVTGSIVSKNTGDGTPSNCNATPAGTLTSGGGNVDSGSNCGLATATDLQNTDPGLGTLTPGLGETPVLPITTLSPAVDLVPAGAKACVGTDQRDLPRPQGKGCDSGAYEVDQAPDTTVSTGPTGRIATPDVSFTFTSNEPGVTFECELDGPGATTGSFAACSSPKAYSGLADGTYTFQVRAVDGTGNQDASPATRSFTVDTTGPDTTLTPIATPTRNSSPSFTFSSSERGATFQCRLDTPSGTGTFAACTSPQGFSGLADGSYTFLVRAVDTVGNADPTPAAQAFVVDTVAPNTTITAGPSGATSNTAPSFSFTSSQSGSTFQCKLDGPGATTGTFAACTSPKAYSAPVQGTYTFSVVATDAAGNTDPTPATRTFTVDTTAPGTTITGGPSGPTNNASPSFGFTSTETGSTFQCKLDGPGATTGSFAACTSPKAYSGLADGAYTFSVRATDAAGNTDATPATRTFTLDAGPPDTTITAGPSGPTSNASPSFAFGSTESNSTFQCKLDGPGAATGAPASCTSPAAYSGLADGAYTFSVTATDPSANADPTPATRGFTVDTTPPPADVVGGPTGTTMDSSPAFTFASADGSVTFECRLDGPGAAIGGYSACSSPHTFDGLAPGSYRFFLRARDEAGNVTETSRAFTVARPIPGRTVVVVPVKGRTLIKRPGRSKFVLLDVTQGIPLGSTLDTRHGRIRLSAIRRRGKPIETALFYGGIFKVTQNAAVTQLALVEKLAACTPTGRKASAARRRSRSRRLWGDGKGSFRTRGQYSSATVRGTKWLVQDSCGRTVTRVARGVVSVKDFVKGRTVSVRAGHTYTARP